MKTSFPDASDVVRHIVGRVNSPHCMNQFTHASDEAQLEILRKSRVCAVLETVGFSPIHKVGSTLVRRASVHPETRTQIRRDGRSSSLWAR